MSQNPTFNSATDLADALLDLIDEEPELLEAPTPPADPFADLDNLLSEALAAQAERTAGERYRKALKSPGLTREEAAEIQAKLREWEDRREWNSVAETALTIRTYCTTCRTTTDSFGGFFKRQTHRNKKDLTRWLAIPKPQGGLPRERALRRVEEKFCLNCLAARGFGKDVAEVVWEGGVSHG